MSFRRLFSLLTLLLPACAALPGGASGEDAPGSELLGMISDARLPEISGLALSLRSPGHWWALNDSGNPAQLFALDSAGRTTAAVTVLGAANVDWEDLACAAGPDGKPFLWIADTGDAGGRRPGGIIYRVPEPPADGSVSSAFAEAFPFTWPDGPRDCECLLVDGPTRTGLLLTKLFLKPGRSEVYRFPLPDGPAAPLTLEKITTGARLGDAAALRDLTAGAVSPDGRTVAVRTYSRGWIWHRLPGRPLESIFESSPAPVDLPPLIQGESIAFSADGKSLLTSSERLPSPFYRTLLPSPPAVREEPAR